MLAGQSAADHNPVHSLLDGVDYVAVSVHTGALSGRRVTAAAANRNVASDFLHSLTPSAISLT